MGIALQQVDLFASIGGGALIGASASILLLGLGRTAGISGILGGLLARSAGDVAWRLAFLAGLLGTGAISLLVAPGAIGTPEPDRLGGLGLVAAGLLVGYGSRLGNGCTSGHGVCGLARLSPRSFVAVAVFLSVGILVATVSRHV